MPNPDDTPNRQELHQQLAEVQSQLDRTPHAFQLVAQRGVLMGMLNRWIDAHRDLDRALRLAPRAHQLKFVIYRMRGMANRILAHYPEAIADFDRALKHTPDASTLAERADVLRSLKRFEEALHDFNASIAQNDRDAFSFLGRGRTHLELDDQESALRDFNRALSISPNDFSVLIERAQLYHNMGQNQSAQIDLRLAERILREQIDRDNEDAEALNNLAWLYSAIIDAHHPEALQLSERVFYVLGEADQRAAYLATRGWTLVRLDRYTEGIPLLERAVELNPYDSDLRSRLQLARDLLP